MSVRIAEYFGHNVRSAMPLSIDEAGTCPFSGQHCYKYPRNQPVCSLWIDGAPEKLYPVCPDRFIRTATSADVQHPHMHAKIMEVARCIWGQDILPGDIAITMGKAIAAGSNVDCIIRRKLEWEIARFPNGFLVEVQVSGDTSNTGSITSFLKNQIAVGDLLPNGMITAGTSIATELHDAGPSYGNVYKRAMMQIMSKGALAMANDLGIALVINRVFLERLKVDYKLPTDNEPHTGRDIVMLIPADASANMNSILDLSIISEDAVRMKWQKFVEWFSQQGGTIDIGGDYSILSGGSQNLP